jgi:5'-methylthioinosine phosphorylase
MDIALAVIGGTGLYQLAGMHELERRTVTTPYGDPSAPIVIGELNGKHIAFLARHGEDHRFAPHRVNYRANIFALSNLGAKNVLAVNAVGGIRDDMGPRALVVPDQLIDYTHGRISSFSDYEGVKVEHVDFSHPYSPSLREAIVRASNQVNRAVVNGGVYAVTQGPRLETVAEVARLRRDGCDLIGMTQMPEAVLARELKLNYACLAVVANWAAGCGDQLEISLEEIYQHLEHGMADVRAVIAALLALL